MSAQIKNAYADGTPKRDVDLSAAELNAKLLGEITQFGLDNVESSQKRNRERDLANRSLAAAGGMSEQPKVIDLRERERDADRAKLLSLAKKAEPEKLFRQLCAGVANNRALKANTALWLMQQIVNQVCSNAAWEWSRRRQENGKLAGLGYTADDAGVFNGYDGRDAGDVEIARDNREIGEGPFTKLDDADSIEDLFMDWYRSIETQLLAMAGASADINGAPMLAGHYSRWPETGEIGNSNRVQVITTFQEEAQAKLTASNDRQVQVAGSKDEVNPFLYS